MINLYSNLYIQDNSGALIGLCICIFNAKKRLGYLATKIVFVIKKAKTNKKIKNHEVRDALILRISHPTQRTNGIICKSKKNSGILFDPGKKKVYTKIFCTRIFGPIAQELRYYHYVKLIMRSPYKY
jgi:ribosomal protein L14